MNEWTDDLRLLKTYGFDTVVDSSWSEYPDDGIVFRINDNAEFEKRGYTSHHPRAAYALKQIQTGVVTTLLDVKRNVGKSGVVAPVAILEPVEIDGATVSKATLHNTRYIEDMGLYIGCIGCLFLIACCTYYMLYTYVYDALYYIGYNMGHSIT